MLNEAQISLTGYVATQPVKRMTKSGVSTVQMRVAWTPRRRDRITGEWLDGNTSYVTVICWRKLATNVAICLRTGDPVLVMGKVSVRTYDDKEGVRRTAVDIDASSVGHDLSRGVSTFQRVRPQTGMTASEFEAARAAESPDGGSLDAGGRDGEDRDGSSVGGDLRGNAAADGDAVPGDADPAAADGLEPDFFDESAISEESLAPEPAAVPF